MKQLAYYFFVPHSIPLRPGNRQVVMRPVGSSIPVGMQAVQVRPALSSPSLGYAVGTAVKGPPVYAPAMSYAPAPAFGGYPTAPVMAPPGGYAVPYIPQQPRPATYLVPPVASGALSPPVYSMSPPYSSQPAYTVGSTAPVAFVGAPYSVPVAYPAASSSTTAPLSSRSGEHSARSAGKPATSARSGGGSTGRSGTGAAGGGSTSGRAGSDRDVRGSARTRGEPGFRLGADEQESARRQFVMDGDAGFGDDLVGSGGRSGKTFY